MSRAIKWILGIGFVLAAATLLVMLVAPSSPLAVPLVIAAAAAFVVLIWMIFARAWRTKGWSIRHPGRFDERTPLE
jgi:hypothetical protein